MKTLNPAAHRYRVDSVTEPAIKAEAVRAAEIASGQVGSEEIAASAVKSGHLGTGAVISGYIASGQIGAAHVYGPGGLASGPSDTYTVYHNLGATPNRQNINLVPRGNAVFWVTSVNNSELVINTNVSGIGCDYWVWA